ncbi:MAG: hypothetical protein LBK27_08195 [Treponema sp.]|jgi:hypothetical protein|nr:hypothetical protein [Treponema sp.]
MKNSIGAKNESGLHRALKFRYAGILGETEAPVGDYVADGVSGDGEIIEVQTGSFGPLKTKVPELARRGPVRIIHPVIVNKYIEVFDGEENKLYRRKSPRKGNEWDLFKALLYAPELPLIPGLCIELALVDVREKRVADGGGSWRRKGQRIAGRELAAWRGAVLLNSPEDYRRFIPFAAGERFTVNDLREKARIPRPLAAKALYVLYKMGLVMREGKKRNAWVYRLREERERVKRQDTKTSEN